MQKTRAKREKSEKILLKDFKNYKLRSFSESRSDMRKKKNNQDN